MRSLPCFVLILGGVFASPSWAQSCGPNGNCDQGQARQDCETVAAAVGPQLCRDYGIQFTYESHRCVSSQSGGASGWFDGRVSCKGLPQPQNSGAHYYKTTCSARPEQTGWRGPGTGSVGSVCSDGCVYDGSVYAGSPIGLLFTPNGQTCTESDHPKPTSPDPGEGDGGGDGGGTDPGGGDGGGTDPGGGDGGGTNPGGGDGGGGTDPGGGDGDGGTDPGGGVGPGPGPGDGEGGDGGAPGPTTGRLYQKSGKTVQKVLAEFKTAIEGAPILSKVKGFFGSCTGGGSCPTATWDGGQYAGKFDLGTLCSGPLLQLFQYAGFVFLAGMGIVALRWALL